MEPQENNNQIQETESVLVENKKSAISMPAAILSGAVIVAIALMVTFGSKSPTSNNQQNQNDTTPTEIPSSVLTIKSTDYVRGDINKAEVVIFEYSDSDCPFCSRFHPTLITLMGEYSGKLAWVYRHFPLTSLHPNAYTEALALQCAGDLGGSDVFNKYLDTIINVTLNADAKSNEALITFATAEGLVADDFKKCIADPKTAAIVDASVAEAQSIGAQGTPFSVAVNIKTGKQVVISGAYPIESVRADIDSLLK